MKGIKLRRNMKAVKRKVERDALKEARKSNTQAPSGATIRRKVNVSGELELRKIVCRYFNRRDRRQARMQALEARYNPNIEVTGRPTVNLISATKYITD